MKNRTTLFVLICTVVASITTGCSTVKEAAHAAPAPDAGFIANPELQSQRADLPFQKVWIQPGFDKSGYQELIIAPVNTDYLRKANWWQQTNLRAATGQYEQDVKDLAAYMRTSFSKAFTEDPNQRFKVVTVPQGKTLQLEMALIEVVPSKPVLNALGLAGPLGSGTAASIVSPRTIAFEARLRDAQTNEIVATFADREQQGAGPIDLTRFTWYEPARRIVDQWAQQLVQVANRKPEESVTDAFPVTLRPW